MTAAPTSRRRSCTTASCISSNTSNTVQALDGRTGELIWENHVGPECRLGYGAMRSLGDLPGQDVSSPRPTRGCYALDARTGKMVWQTAIADSKKGYGNTSGPHRDPRQGRAGPRRVRRSIRDRGLLHQRVRRGDRQTALEVSNRARARASPAATLGARLPNLMRAGGETWITGSYDPDLNQTYWGVAQAKPWMRASRGAEARRQGAVHQLDAGAESGQRQARLVLPARAGRIAGSRRSVRARAGRQRRPEADVHHRQGRRAVEAGPRDRQVSRRSRKRSFRTSSRRIDPQTGEPTYRNDIVEQKIGKWMQACPSTEGGHNWQAMSYHPGTNQLIIPLSQSCMEMIGADRRIQGRLGRRRRAAALLRNAGHERQHRQAGGVRCRDHEGELVDRAARAFPDGSALDGRRRRVRGRPRPLLQRRGRQDRRRALETRLGTSVQGFPVSFAIGGKQYIAVTTGLGGGSPRDCAASRSRRRFIIRETATRCTCSRWTTSHSRL